MFLLATMVTKFSFGEIKGKTHSQPSFYKHTRYDLTTLLHHKFYRGASLITNLRKQLSTICYHGNGKFIREPEFTFWYQKLCFLLWVYHAQFSSLVRDPHTFNSPSQAKMLRVVSKLKFCAEFKNQYLSCHRCRFWGKNDVFLLTVESF